MGLDMYLYKKHYVKNWDFMKDSEKHSVVVTKGGLPTNIQPERVSEVTEQVGYWRKANAIHKWFVDNVQDGIDDCGEHYVGQESLQKLLAVVTRLLETKSVEDAIRELPTQSGFLFGNTSYDDWYFRDLQTTKDILTTLLAENGSGELYYHSSW